MAFVVQYFNDINKKKDLMKFNELLFNKIKIVWINETSFYLAAEKENIEIIKLLLTIDNLDINIPYVLS